MQLMAKLAKKVRLGGLKALYQRPRRRLLGYQKVQLSSAVYSSLVRPPAGHFPVYVGEERERFVIPTAFLSHPLFSALLEKAYQEYGFKQVNGLRLPCNVSVFMHVVSAVEKSGGQLDVEKITGEHDFW
ncbi:auxin-induced protein 6B-like [Phalaenopsis equestris]|uniref:auxin-induced protein 6B-like n=1 Tax=Phalaenopsis equestris TaxID=78828 RepID=UPI0009E28CE0|nr:auxin-induced protein 6B-like [Phalaenopsis equestris]